ncbi:hypothetical protein [Candidatus Laterigemmans baculatus]|uniref:hypothetical protein n=1 Tax=Candidatus Laterigemmans baculatus TaxID=2770505 RepID=UPI0013DC0875|nr:hypothetical protein [Candidatus Laterigemmans baculatus]
MSGDRQAAEWKVVLTKYDPFYCEGDFEEELRSRKGLPPKGTHLDERDESKLQAADTTAFFDVARERLVALKPRRTALVFDEARWNWALRHLIEGEDESTATLEEISMEEAYEWVEGPPSPNEAPPELYFHANFGIPGVAYFPNERGLWEFDPRDGWFFLGVTGTTAQTHKYVFANDREIIEISKVGKEDVVAEYSPLIESISRLLEEGLVLPERILQSCSLDTLASELEHATPSTGSNDQTNETAATIVTEFLANGLGTVATVFPVSIEADKETCDNDTSDETGDETGEHPGALEHLWPSAVIANLTGQPKILANLMNEAAANPETENERTPRRLLGLPKGSVAKEKVAKAFRWSERSADNNWESLKRRFHAQLDELEARGITEPRGVHRWKNHVVITETRPKKSSKKNNKNSISGKKTGSIE